MILYLLMTCSNEHMQKKPELTYINLSASTPDLKRSWYLQTEASVKEIHSSLEVLPGPVLPDDHTVH